MDLSARAVWYYSSLPSYLIAMLRLWWWIEEEDEWPCSNYYTKLLQFLQNNKLNVCEFMTGASIPFTEVVRPTNTISERDFALLDCYIREKSNAIHMFGISRRRFLKELCSQYDVIDGVLHLQNPATPGWWCIVVP